MLVFICFFGVGNSRAALVGPNISSKGVNLTGVGTAQWSNAVRVKAIDGSCAKVSLDPSEVSNYLVGRGLGFSLPMNAQISGIQVTIGYYSTTGVSRIQDSEVRLVKGGVVTGNSKAISNTNWPITETAKTYGQDSSLWGATWKASDINSVNFGVALSVKNASTTDVNTAYVDYIQVTVYYGMPKPTIQASNLSFSNETGSSMTISWKSGNGTNCIVLMKESAPVDSDPVDLITYKSSSTFGAGDQIGFRNFVVFTGDTLVTSVNVTGLNSSTKYYISVYTYNSPSSKGNNTENVYMTPGATGENSTRPASQDYQSAQTGFWNDVSTWQIYNDKANPPGWEAAKSAPDAVSSGKITILNGHIVTVSTAITADEVQINTGGKVTVSSTGSWTIQDGAGTDLSVDGIVENSGVILLSGPKQNSIPTVAFNSGSFYYHAKNDGNIIVASWDVGSTCFISGVTTTVPLVGGLNQSFGNFTWKCPGQTGVFDLQGNLKTIKKDFSLQSTGSGSLSLGSIAGDLSIGGKYIQSGGVLYGTQSAINRVITVAGDFALSGGTLDLNTGSGVDSLKVAGNFSHTGGILTVSGTSVGSGVVFNGTVPQIYTSGGTVSNKVNYTVLSDAYLQMGAGAILSGNGNFSLLQGATLGVTSPEGISKSGSTGNVQVAGARAYTLGANYEYNGVSAQFTGDGLSQSKTGDVKINNASGVSLSRSVIVGGSLFVNSGAKFSQGDSLITLYGDFVNRGTLISSGGGLKITDVADQSIETYVTTGTVSMTKTEGLAMFLGDFSAGALLLNGNGGILHLGYGRNHSTGNLTLTAGVLNAGSSTLNIGGNVTKTGGTFTANAGTIFYSGSGNQTVADLSYNHLGFAGSGVKTIPISLIVGGNLSVASGPSLVLSPGKALTVTGSISNSGAFTLSSDTIDGTATLIDNGVVNGGGAFSVQQYLRVASRNYYMASPVSDAKGLLASFMYYYDEPTYSWQNVMPGDPLVTLKGYILNNNTKGIVNFSGGQFNTAGKSIAINRTAGVYKAGFNLIGNPYPSYVDLKAAMQSALDNGDLEPTIWYRTKTNTVPSTYVFETVNTTTGVGTTVSTGVPVTQYLPPMQSVWVRVASGKTSATISFTNAMRSHTDLKYASNRLRSATVDDNRVLRLRVSNGVNDDELIFVFNPSASDGYDAYDSEKMLTTSANVPQLYTVVNGVQLSIDGLNNVSSANTLPLVFSTGEANRYTIRASEIYNFDPDTKFVLVDNLQQTSYDLSSGGSYAFATTSAVTTANRFTLLVDTKSNVATALNQTEVLPDVQIYADENKQIVVEQNRTKVNGKVIVVNSLGQIVVSENLTESATTLKQRLFSGVYVVTATVGNKQLTKKITIR
ncbi:MAG: T9SS type A sorting domain-containing protein [Bacteroidota bacterium]|nr:T9SS type A sorting domain-containing protein [Bacteroidota bacterium]